MKRRGSKINNSNSQLYKVLIVVGIIGIIFIIFPSTVLAAPEVGKTILKEKTNFRTLTQTLPVAVPASVQRLATKQARQVIKKSVEKSLEKVGEKSLLNFEKVGSSFKSFTPHLTQKREISVKIPKKVSEQIRIPKILKSPAWIFGPAGVPVVFSLSNFIQKNNKSEAFKVAQEDAYEAAYSENDEQKIKALLSPLNSLSIEQLQKEEVLPISFVNKTTPEADYFHLVSLVHSLLDENAKTSSKLITLFLLKPFQFTASSSSKLLNLRGGARFGPIVSGGKTQQEQDLDCMHKLNVVITLLTTAVGGLIWKLNHDHNLKAQEKAELHQELEKIKKALADALAKKASEDLRQKNLAEFKEASRKKLWSTSKKLLPQMLYLIAFIFALVNLRAIFQILFGEQQPEILMSLVDSTEKVISMLIKSVENASQKTSARLFQWIKSDKNRDEREATQAEALSQAYKLIEEGKASLEDLQRQLANSALRETKVIDSLHVAQGLIQQLKDDKKNLSVEYQNEVSNFENQCRSVYYQNNAAIAKHCYDLLNQGLKELLQTIESRFFQLDKETFSIKEVSAIVREVTIATFVHIIHDIVPFKTFDRESLFISGPLQSKKLIKSYKMNQRILKAKYAKLVNYMLNELSGNKTKSNLALTEFQLRLHASVENKMESDNK